MPEGDDADHQVPREESDLAEILYTSGTTGRPKGVAIRHGNSALYLMADPQWSGRAWLHASPMFTFAGLTFVYQPMRMGMRTLYLPHFDAQEWLRLVAEQRPAGAFLVPSMVELLLASSGVHDADLSGLELASVGSAPIAPSTIDRFAALVPQALVSNSYSMTEAGTAYCLLPEEERSRRPGSVGKPLPPAEIRVVGEDGRPLASEIGEIVIKPAGRMREYYRDPEATAEVFAADGWLRTGDLGRLDEDGYLYVVGRSKDVRGGYNIYATDVEGVLYECPAAARPRWSASRTPCSARRSRRTWSCARRSPRTSSTPTVARGWPDKVPRRYVVRDALPRNAADKVLKREPREG